LYNIFKTKMTSQFIKDNKDSRPGDDFISLALEEARAEKAHLANEPTVHGFDSPQKRDQHIERAIAPGNVTRADSRVLAKRLKGQTREDAYHVEANGKLIDYLRDKHNVDEHGRLAVIRAGESPNLKKSLYFAGHPDPF
jgi:hypothetical protein